MKLKNILLIIVLCFVFFPSCKSCDKEYTKCSSDLLEIKDNYTIEITDGGEYSGIYYVTNDLTEKITQGGTYYYFAGDENRYYRAVNEFNYTFDNGQIDKTLNTIKSFFTGAKNLYVNEDKTIFKTVTGNKIYDIGKTQIEFSDFDKNTQEIEVKKLSEGKNYIITDGAIKIKTDSELIYYIVTTSGLKKFCYNGSWLKMDNDYSNIYDLRDEILDSAGDKFVKQGNIYLSTKGVSLKENNQPLCETFPNLTDNSYTFSEIGTNKIFSVTPKSIKITDGDKFEVYKKTEEGIDVYSNDNFNGYITKRFCPEYTSLQDVIKNYKSDFAFSYLNNSKTSYLIIGNTKEYELTKINSTVIYDVKENAEIIDNLYPYIYGHNFTLKDTKRNFDYVFAGTVLEIVNYNLNVREYYSYEDSAVYHIKYVDNQWEKTMTDYQLIYDAFDFVTFSSDAVSDNILMVTDKKGDYDFESPYYKILGYDQFLEIDLPN